MNNFLKLLIFSFKLISSWMLYGLFHLFSWFLLFISWFLLFSPCHTYYGSAAFMSSIRLPTQWNLLPFQRIQKKILYSLLLLHMMVNQPYNTLLRILHHFLMMSMIYLGIQFHPYFFLMIDHLPWEWLD